MEKPLRQLLVWSLSPCWATRTARSTDRKSVRWLVNCSVKAGESWVNCDCSWQFGGLWGLLKKNWKCAGNLYGVYLFLFCWCIISFGYSNASQRPTSHYHQYSPGASIPLLSTSDKPSSTIVHRVHPLSTGIIALLLINYFTILRPSPSLSITNQSFSSIHQLLNHHENHENQAPDIRKKNIVKLYKFTIIHH